jgi:hypothetical protein
MLLIILIGAALTHMRPEPLTQAAPADPEPQHIKAWRTCLGVASVLALASPPKNRVAQ